MLARIKQTFTRKRKTLRPRAELTQTFYSSPYHEWIIQNRYIKASFEEFFSSIPHSELARIVEMGIKFISLKGNYSAAVSDKNIILIFPELQDMLQGLTETPFKAILAHEIGHLVYGHGKKEMTAMEAQIEADRYAIELGFADELEEFLLGEGANMEAKLRLTYLTNYVLKNSDL